MARFARVVLPGFPYHVTHRGNRREDVFFRSEDRDCYRRWLGEYARKYGLEIWAYCLMSNHVHLLAVPRREDALTKAIGRTHMRHARHVNREEGWSGHLWANRFYSTALDEAHLWAAVKYVELNPVRAGLAECAEEWSWSSARSHALGEPDPLLSAGCPFPAPDLVGDWSDWLSAGLEAEKEEAIRKNTYTGRPTGSEGFIAGLEKRIGRLLRPQKAGRKRRNT